MSCCCFHARKKPLPHSQQDIDGFSSKNIKLFSYNELRSATDNFHPRNKIGRGGFGTVYKGILKDRTPVAAKVLSAESKQGVKEFLTEIDIITNVRHPNLVELIGCCVQGSNRILVYEYVENNSLDHALLGPRSEAKLNWAIRAEICLGTARGLAFLHEELEPPIVHRDIKASNILLDRHFAPKIGDFGLAKLFPDNITHISTRVAGTTGYLAPEYAIQGQLTKKADIYSFGVLMLEIISGRSSSKSSWSEMGKFLLEWDPFLILRFNITACSGYLAPEYAMQGQLTKKADIYSFGVLMLEIISGRSSSKSSWSEMEKFLLEWTWQLYKEGRLTVLVDPTLGDYPEDQVLRYIKVALFCTQAAAARRPAMAQVVEMLSKPLRLNEKELTPPGLLQDSTRIRIGSKATNSSSLLMKDSASTSTTIPFTSTPITFTDMVPR